ncbi:MAG: tetratricopeptide repeat protein [Desulfovermiculus sp.]
MNLIQKIARPQPRQYVIYFSCLALIGVSLPFLYHHLHQEQVLFHHGQKALAADEYSRAEAYFEQARQAGLQSPRFLQQMAQVHMRLGHWDQAEDAYRHLLAQQPEDMHIKLELARILFIQGRFGKALDKVQRILEHKPDWSFALYLQGKIYTAQGNFEEAIHAYKVILGEK